MPSLSISNLVRGDASLRRLATLSTTSAGHPLLGRILGTLTSDGLGFPVARAMWHLIIVGGAVFRQTPAGACLFTILADESKYDPDWDTDDFVTWLAQDVAGGGRAIASNPALAQAWVELSSGAPADWNNAKTVALTPSPSVGRTALAALRASTDARARAFADRVAASNVAWPRMVGWDITESSSVTVPAQAATVLHPEVAALVRGAPAPAPAPAARRPPASPVPSTPQRRAPVPTAPFGTSAVPTTPFPDMGGVGNGNTTRENYAILKALLRQLAELLKINLREVMYFVVVFWAITSVLRAIVRGKASGELPATAGSEAFSNAEYRELTFLDLADDGRVQLSSAFEPGTVDRVFSARAAPAPMPSGPGVPLPADDDLGVEAEPEGGPYA